MDWVEKYRPEHLQDIVGNGSAIRRITDWARSWTRDSPPLILYGKPGTGKTSSAHALASDMKWDIIELNASDQRTKAAIERIAGTSSTTTSLTGASRKLIVFDEADNLHGSADRGGAKAILDIIKNTFQPIILIANDIYGIDKAIKARCEGVQFKAIQARSIVPRLRYICASEGVSCDADAVMSIAESCAGDLRAAVNMLYAAAAGNDTLTTAAVQTSQKDERSTIFELVGSVFKGKEDDRLMTLSYELSDTPDTIEQWIEGNLGQVDSIEAQAQAYEYIAHADEFIGRTYRRQYYMLWRYATALMLIGTASATGDRGLSGRVMPPARWRKMSAAKKQKSLRAGILRKLSSSMHMPDDTLREDFLTPITLMVEQNPVPFVKELNLDKDELNFFLHDKTRSGKIIKDLAKEEKEREKAAKKKKAGKKDKPAPEPVQEIKTEEKAEEKPEANSVAQSTLFDVF